MRRKYILLAIRTALTVLALTIPVQAVDVNFADPDLETVVRDALGIPPPTSVTDANMLTLSTLDAGGSNIDLLTGLEYGHNLTDLGLFDNQISDISAISGLTNLQMLYLGNNQISDISAVSGLTKLTGLYLYNNQISDISAVSNLTNLQIVLYLNNNQISDISAVSTLTKLQLLYLNNNQISDISALSSLTSLYRLDLYDNQISDISAVSGLTTLNELSLNNNQIGDISAVSSLTNLSCLDLNNNQISLLDLTGLEAPNLTYFGIAGNPITEVILEDAMLSQTTFATLGGSFAGLGGIATADLSAADMLAVEQLDAMFGMDDLVTLDIPYVTFNALADAEGLIAELTALDFLTVDNVFYADNQGWLDTWDADAANTLIVIPEPATLGLMVIGGLVVLFRKRRKV